MLPRSSGHGVGTRIDPHVRRLVEQRLALVGARIAARVAADVVVGRPIALAARADLQQQRLAVVRVLLDDAIAVAGDPDVVLIVDEAAVDAVRQHVAIAPGVDHVARLIELDHRRRRHRVERLRRVDEIAARDDEDVVARVDAGAGHLAGRPRLGLAGRRADDQRCAPVAGAGQRHLRPGSVDDVARSARCSGRVGLAERHRQAESGDRERRSARVQVRSSFHDVSSCS